MKRSYAASIDTLRGGLGVCNNPQKGGAGTAPAEHYFNSELSGLVDRCSQAHSVSLIRLTLYCVTPPLKTDMLSSLQHQ